ncbi:transglycosylase family protein [Streptomyces sp. CB03911]|uniref:transglycosylase family protein n=1 Tax=Streptomyces sp. CB03911 TaxID=1804758 RepID=UPI0025706862|nr:transglycosylase family protein [Streptomyces sp. CB03911]
MPGAPVRPAVHDAVWDELAQCESSGDWRADTGNGYYGGLQIWPPTWAEAGGPAFADRPDHATRHEQIVVAEQILRMQGWGAWPVCSREIGATNIEPEPEPELSPGLGPDPDLGPGPGPDLGPGPAPDPGDGQDPGPAPDPSAGSEPVPDPWSDPQGEAGPGPALGPGPDHERLRGRDRTRAAHGRDRAPHRDGVPPAGAPAPLRP